MTQAKFVISAVSEGEFPHERIPEFVFAGRSNVGKSSLINRLAGKANLARTSATPGKTQTINFYLIDEKFFFVDLPGFGYAKAAKAEVRRWRESIERYFQSRSTIALVLHLLDSRMPPTELDIRLSDWLVDLKLPEMLVATKADKLSNNQRSASQRVITNSFRGQPVVMSSAKTGEGCKEIWQQVLKAAALVESSKR